MLDSSLTNRWSAAIRSRITGVGNSQQITVTGTSYRRGLVSTCASLVARRSTRLGHRDAAKVLAQLVGEVGHLEHRLVRQRNSVVHDGQLIVNCAPGGERSAVVDVIPPRDAGAVGRRRFLSGEGEWMHRVPRRARGSCDVTGPFACQSLVVD